MPTGREHGAIVMNLGAELRNFIKPRRLGWLVGSDSGVWLERDPDTVREPDVAFYVGGEDPAREGCQCPPSANSRPENS